MSTLDTLKTEKQKKLSFNLCMNGLAKPQPNPGKKKKSSLAMAAIPFFPKSIYYSKTV